MNKLLLTGGGLVAGLSIAGGAAFLAWPEDAATDVVVNVKLRCEYRGVDYEGDPCENTNAANRRKVVTVRSASGGAYTVEVDAGRAVEPGDSWLPGSR